MLLLHYSITPVWVAGEEGGCVASALHQHQVAFYIVVFEKRKKKVREYPGFVFACLPHDLLGGGGRKR